MLTFCIVLTTLSEQFLNNSIYFDFCGSKYNASYIYLDPSDISFDIENRFEYKLNATCNQSIEYFPINVGIPQNITSSTTKVGAEWDMFNYVFIIVSTITFLIGLTIQPEVLYNSLIKRMAHQLHAGNVESRIRTKL